MFQLSGNKIRVGISFLLAFLLSASPVAGTGRLFETSTNDELANAATVAAALPVTFFSCFRSTTASVKQSIIWGGDVDNAGRWIALTLDATNHVQAEANAGAGINAGTSTGTYSTNTWYCAVAVFTSTTDRRIYWQAENVQNTTSTSWTTPDRVCIGRLCDSSSSNTFDGDICWSSAWSAALSAEEASALLSGANPMRIRPLDRVAVWPLWAMHLPEINIGNTGFSMTQGGGGSFPASAGGCPVNPWNF